MTLCILSLDEHSMQTRHAMSVCLSGFTSMLASEKNACRVLMSQKAENVEECAKGPSSKGSDLKGLEGSSKTSRVRRAATLLR